MFCCMHASRITERMITQNITSSMKLVSVFYIRCCLLPATSCVNNEKGKAVLFGIKLNFELKQHIQMFLSFSATHFLRNVADLLLNVKGFGAKANLSGSIILF